MGELQTTDLTLRELIFGRGISYDSLYEQLKGKEHEISLEDNPVTQIIAKSSRDIVNIDELIKYFTSFEEEGMRFSVDIHRLSFEMGRYQTKERLMRRGLFFQRTSEARVDKYEFNQKCICKNMHHY